MGGNLGGDIPQNFNKGQMEIDYVRVYQWKIKGYLFLNSLSFFVSWGITSNASPTIP